MSELEELRQKLRVAKDQFAELKEYIQQVEERIRTLEGLPPLPPMPSIGRYTGLDSFDVFSQLIKAAGKPLHMNELIDAAVDGGLRLGSPKSSAGQVRGYGVKAIKALAAVGRLKLLPGDLVDVPRGQASSQSPSGNH